MKTDKKWYEKPYNSTQVSVSETVSQIKALLMKYDVEAIQQTEFRNTIVIRFALREDDKLVPFEFEINLPDIDSHQGERKQKQYARAYYWYLKSKIETIKDFGIKEFKDEFMGARLLKLPNGQMRRLEEIVNDQENKLEYANEFYLPFKE